MKEIGIDISALHAEALATYFIVVLKNYLSGKAEGSIPEDKLRLLEQLDSVFQKLNRDSKEQDDESRLTIHFSIPEAEAFIKAFTDEEFKQVALQDQFFRENSYAAYFGQIFSTYLEVVSSGYVEALAA